MKVLRKLFITLIVYYKLKTVMNENVKNKNQISLKVTI